MAGWDDVSTPVAQPAASGGWDAVSTPSQAQMPDLSGVRQTATQNMQAPQEGEEFGAKLDRAAGMPVSAAIGSKDNTASLSPAMRGHLVDAYAKGTAQDAGDFMQSAVPAVASVAAPQVADQTPGVATGLLDKYALSTYRQYEALKFFTGHMLGNESMAQEARSNLQMANEAEAETTPKIGSATGRFAYGAASSVVNAVPSLLAAALNPIAGLAGFGAQSGLEESGQVAARGGTPGQAAAAGGATGAVTAATSLLPMKYFTDSLGKVGLGEFFTNLLARTTPTMVAQQVANSAIDTAVANPNKTWSQWLKEQPEGIAQAITSGLLFAGVGQATHMVSSSLHPELQSLVGEKIGKPAEAVTQNDIASAIRMGFEDKAPKAQDFKDTASVILGPGEKEAGTETLRTVYKDTGVAPDKVFDDAQRDPQIASEIRAGKIPAAYESLIEKPEEKSPFDVEPKQRTLPENNYTGNLSEHSPTVFRQASVGNALELMPYGGVSTDVGEVHLADHPEMALGQGANKEGIQLAFDTANLKGRINLEKPGLPLAYQQGMGEYVGKHNSQSDYVKSLTGVRVPKTLETSKVEKAMLKRTLSNLEKNGWTKEDKGDFVEYRKGKSEIPTAEEPVITPPTKEEYAQILERRDLSPEHQEIEKNLGVPETMNKSQLGKANARIEQEFTKDNGAPEDQKMSDEQYKALEDYGRRVEASQERLKTQTPAVQIKNIISDQSGALTIPDEVKELGQNIKRDILNFATPMETGSERAQASAKDFANRLRFAQWNGSRISNLLQDRFTPEELKGMWDALDEASVHAQKLESNGMSRDNAMAQTEKYNIGHFALPEEQKEIIKSLSDWAQHSWDQAMKLGMVDGEGLPFWTPRMAAVIGEDGEWGTPQGEGKRPSVDIGGNLKTTTGSLKNRKYLTSEETEAAMKKAFGDEQGEGAMLVRDIRAMPLALTRLEQAIAGRSLVDEIKSMGVDTGAETISSSPREGYFTLDHPALQTYRPVLKLNDEGKWEVQKDVDGNDMFEKTPVYISKEFEGPLKAVLSQKSSDTYKALMALKGKSMGLIMYSPIIHNAVEWGRAFPLFPGKVFFGKIYFEGNRVKNDPAQMQEAIKAGMVPIGARFFNQDISSVIEQPNLTPGRSWTAKLLGNAVGAVSGSEKAGNAVKAAIDKAGDIWHNTLLWDRVGDLQAGIYSNVRDASLKNGMEPEAAQAVAAHLANRFAGALPMESMGNMARKMANLTMFSRSFTIGNLGVMKDMVKGLPSDVLAQLNRDIGESGAKAASKATRRAAIGTFVLDIGLMYAGNSLLQDTLDHLKRDKTLGQIGQGYVDRFNKMMQKHSGTPWDLLNLPSDMQEMSSTSTHEPGKEDRILYSKDPKTGTAYYMRLPVGKIGEEFKGWLTSPLEMARKKVSPLVSPLIDTYRNGDYFGHPIYDKDARGISGAVENLGKVVTHIMEDQVPTESIASAYHLLTGSSHNESLDTMKTLGPLAGLTFSKGYPGGPEAGILAASSRRHEAEISVALPQIKEAVESDKEDKAHDLMEKLGMTSREQASLIRHYQNPAGKVNSRSLGKFERTATPEEKELMDEQ